MAEINKISDQWISEDLKSALANAYNKLEHEITKQFLSNLKEINLSGRDIKNISGIQFAFNITNLDLSKNEIKDASFLSSLYKLTDLNLSYNQIRNASFLKYLKRLKFLDLEANNISHIPDLENIKTLQVINISNNKIGDLSFIKTLRTQDVKIIASDQCILLKGINVNYGDDYTFSPKILWDDHTHVLFDNVQIDGCYSSIETDKRPSLLYSISKVIIKNICSDCIIKVDFYHEVNFFKSGILSGILIQPILVKLYNTSFHIKEIKKEKIQGSIKGRLILITNTNKEGIINEDILNNKIITLINSNGKKISTLTNERGEYIFKNLYEGRYTILFPFINDYEYIAPSLQICNLKYGDILEINSSFIKK